MATFFMFGKYSSEALKSISAERTKKAMEMVRRCGGKVQSIHALLGKHDLVIIADFDAMEQAMKASVSLTKMTNIAFTTSLAITAEKFDEIMAEV